jgi:riboflavin transporter FmnP
MLKSRTKQLAVTGMLLAVGIILPFATTHGLGLAGTVLLPMHIPVLLCGLLCGPLYGAACGFMLPVLNALLTGMPTIYPMMPIMAMELMTYGAVSGWTYHRTPLHRLKFGVYPAMLIAMVCGRVVYGLTFEVLLIISGELKALTVWSAVVTGLPGILVQLLLVPGIVLALRRYIAKGGRATVISAIHLIEQKKVACVVIRNGVIECAEMGRGIGPVLKLYDEGVLKDAYVVDKIIGKAAAMILTQGGVKGCYGLTMSRAAYDWLATHGVKVDCRECVDVIINRAGDGMCPMEETVLNIDDAEEGIEALRRKRAELMKNSK